MAVVKRASPKPGTYQHALVRYDWPPNQVYMERMHGEVAESRCIALPVGWKIPGVVGIVLVKPRGLMTVKPVPGGYEVADGTSDQRSVSMLFVCSKHLATRCTKLGWIEVTDQWSEHVAGLSEEVVEDLSRTRERVPAPERKTAPVEDAVEDEPLRSSAERVTSIPAGSSKKGKPKEA